ncbi:MAG: 50S ribosomal protein L13 [Spirochaetae bacterium HGW-Spirochaetae-1]|jgi:large subunit ribosomal protein L13|nr:MAG: 50S ribosomal protein L13 [Spirochaetae bacterium HGW-Spirochaetae-1]
MSIQKTYSIKESQVEKNWVLIDAEGKILGRLATKVADILRGKNKPTFTSHMDMGDNVIIINAEKVVLTGKKSEDKDYFTHSKFPGGDKFINIKKIMAEQPEYVIMHAVKGMLPKSKLGKQQITNLRVYAGPEHPHDAQQPVKVEI